MTKHQSKKLAHAYVPKQHLSSIFSEETSLKNGTIFPELYQPYEERHKCHHHHKCGQNHEESFCDKCYNKDEDIIQYGRNH